MEFYELFGRTSEPVFGQKRPREDLETPDYYIERLFDMLGPDEALERVKQACPEELQWFGKPKNERCRVLPKDVQQMILEYVKARKDVSAMASTCKLWQSGMESILGMQQSQIPNASGIPVDHPFLIVVGHAGLAVAPVPNRLFRPLDRRLPKLISWKGFLYIRALRPIKVWFEVLDKDGIAHDTKPTRIARFEQGLLNFNKLAEHRYQTWYLVAKDHEGTIVRSELTIDVITRSAWRELALKMSGEHPRKTKFADYCWNCGKRISPQNGKPCIECNTKRATIEETYAKHGGHNASLARGFIMWQRLHENVDYASISK